jgi:hypothetical protein
MVTCTICTMKATLQATSLSLATNRALDICRDRSLAAKLTCADVVAVSSRWRLPRHERVVLAVSG